MQYYTFVVTLSGNGIDRQDAWDSCLGGLLAGGLPDDPPPVDPKDGQLERSILDYEECQECGVGLTEQPHTCKVRQ